MNSLTGKPFLAGNLVVLLGDTPMGIAFLAVVTFSNVNKSTGNNNITVACQLQRYQVGGRNLVGILGRGLGKTGVDCVCLAVVGALVKLFKQEVGTCKILLL